MTTSRHRADAADTPQPTRRGEAARSKRMERGDQSREVILDAASLLMSSKGYSGTSVADIQRESGLPASSIYWHFESKSGVLAAVMERGARRYFDEVAAFVITDDLTPGQKMRALLEHSDLTVGSHPEFLRLFMVLLLGADAGESPREVVARVREEGRRRLHRGLELSFAAWGPDKARLVADELAEFALVMFDGSFIAMQADSPATRAGLLDQHCDALMTLARKLVEQH